MDSWSFEHGSEVLTPAKNAWSGNKKPQKSLFA